MTRRMGCSYHFWPGDDLIDAMAQQGQRVVLHALRLTWVAEQRGPGQTMTLIEGPPVAADAASPVIHGTIAVEGAAELRYTTSCRFGMLRNVVLGSAKTQSSGTF